MYYVAANETLLNRLCGRFAARRRPPRAEPGRPVRARHSRPRPLAGLRWPGAIRIGASLPPIGGAALTLILFRFVLPDAAPSWLTELLGRGPLQPVIIGVTLMGLLALGQRALAGDAERRAARRAEHREWPRGRMVPDAARLWLAAGESVVPRWVRQRLARVIEAVESDEPVGMARDRLARGDRDMLRDLHQMPRAAISALPLLGLGGTVLGLSAGMGRLAGFIQGASDVAGLREVLTSFSGSLGTAFDATLLALALMAPLLVLAGVVRDRDEATLRLIDGLAERFSASLARPVPAGVDEIVVRHAVDRVVTAVERGLDQILMRIGQPGSAGLPAHAVDALAELPRVLEAVCRAVAEPRELEISVAAPARRGDVP